MTDDLLCGFRSSLRVSASAKAYAAAISTHRKGSSRSPILETHNEYALALRLYTMLSPSQKWLKRVRTYISACPLDLDRAGVYILLSPFTKHYYIGSTDHFRRRLFQHLFAPLCDSRSLAPVHRLMQLLGPHTFVMLPLLYTGPHDNLLQLERRFIAILHPSLNVRDRPHKQSRRPSAARRWRVWSKLTNISAFPSAAHVSQPFVLPASFLSRLGHSFDICSHLSQVSMFDQPLNINCVPGWRLSDLAKLRWQYGHFPCVLCTSQGQQLFSSLGKILTHLPRAVFLRVYPLRPHDPEASLVEWLLRIARRQDRRAALYSCSLQQLIQLLRTCKRLPRDDALKCKLAIHKACLTRFGFDLRPLVMRLPVFCGLPDKHARSICASVLSTLHLPPPLFAHAIRSLRIVRSAPCNIAAVLCNHRHAARAYDEHRPPACVCHSIRGLLPTDPDGHVCFRGGAASNVFLPALAASGKTVPHFPPHSAALCAREAFIAFWRNAAQFANSFTPASTAAQLSAIPHAADLLRFQQAPPTAGITYDAVLATRAVLCHLGLVCAPLDRNPNALFVECPLRYWQRMDKLFVHDPHYQRVHTSHSDLLSAMRDQFSTHSWMTRAPWNPSGTLCTSYALPKYKDPVSKSRPVVPAHRHPARRLLKAVSLVLMRLIAFRSNQQGHFNITATNNVVPALQRINDSLTSVPGDTSLVTFDVKNMFTELPHPAIRRAVTQFLQWHYDTRAHPPDQRSTRVPSSWLVHIGRRRVCASTRQYDASRCIVVRATDLLAAVEFELSNIFFTVGTVTLQQTVGISMGGYLSPAMAMITCMMAERNMAATLGADARFINGIRYMDDCTTILRTSDPAMLARLRHIALHAYPEGLECEVTGEGRVTRMLEQQLRVHDGIVTAAHYNKNTAALLTGGTPPFVSFLPASAPNGVPFYNGWIKGSCARILANTSTLSDTMSSQLVLLFLESCALHYSPVMFFKALRQFHPKQHALHWGHAARAAQLILGGF